MQKNRKTTKTRRRFDDQFKIDAVRHVIETGKPIKQVAGELGLERSSLGRWKREFLGELDEQAGGCGKGMKPSEMEAELRRLRLELREVSEQRDI